MIGVKDRMRRLEEVALLSEVGKHPNVVELKSSWEQFGHLYIETELCEAGRCVSLASFIIFN